MKSNKIIVMLGIVCLLASLVFPLASNKVYAATKNEVTLNFKGGTIYDDYVEYTKVGKIQLFKGDDIVTNISNNMVIDLNEADYKFVIQEIPGEDTGSVVGIAPVRLNINNWYYSITAVSGKASSTFKLESSKFSGTLDVKLERARTIVNTKVENVYDNTTSTGIIDLSEGKSYVIDFTKDDQLTVGLKTFADLEKTIYYKRDYNGLLATENESEAVIKIVGNKSENKAIITAVNVGDKKEEKFTGMKTQYTGSKLQYDGTEGGIINETRTDYYTRCTYEFTFKYANENASEGEYTFLEGQNQSYVINKSNNATCRIDAEYSLFENEVYIDGVKLDVANFDSKSGSTIIILKNNYLKTLSVGKHTLKVKFSNGKVAVTNFTIAKEGITNPNTKDNIFMYVGMLGISLTGVIILSAVNRKKNNTEYHNV